MRYHLCLLCQIDFFDFSTRTKRQICQASSLFWLDNVASAQLKNLSGLHRNGPEKGILASWRGTYLVANQKY